MSKPTDVRVSEARSWTERIEYRTPMKFGGRVVTDVTLLNVELAVETRNGQTARGFGSMPMGNIWAWPSPTTSAAQTLDAMIKLGERLVDEAPAGQTAGHPLELTHHWAQHYARHAHDVRSELQLGEAMPRLAQLVAASPLEAAVHDAYGRALGQNSYNLLSSEFVNRDLSYYLGDDFRGEYLNQYTLRQPKPSMPLYHLVGALDPLTAQDQAERIDDGLPETLGEWIMADGLTHMKIKLNGDDLPWDVQRVLGVDQVAREYQHKRGCSRWYYSLDFNEKCDSVEYVLEFLSAVQRENPAAYDRIQYIEQPTHRDLQAHPENRMDRAAERKPVVIDESLVDLESLLLSRQMGYSGVALKACKGHSEALLMGAAAQKYGLFLCVQDLTCPGASFLHSASLAARVPTVAAIEGNARQYCPAGNRQWSDWYPSMFMIRDGTVGTRVLDGPGLGFASRNTA